MTSIPPLLPEEALARVVRLARFDGLSVVVLASLFALMAAADHERAFAMVGVLAAGAGAIELHGVGLLRQYDARGMSWIIASQPLLLLVVLGYCALKVAHFEMPPIPENWQAMMNEGAERLGMTLEQYYALANRITAGVVAGAACLYQGGMTIYYARRRRVVAQAMEVVEE